MQRSDWWNNAQWQSKNGTLRVTISTVKWLVVRKLTQARSQLKYVAMVHHSCKTNVIIRMLSYYHKLPGGQNTPPVE